MDEYIRHKVNPATKKLSDLERKFASEEALKRERTLKEKSGLLDSREGNGESKSLFEQLSEKKRLAEEELVNKTKFSNLIHCLDADECAFINYIDEKNGQAQLELKLEEKEKLERFRKESERVKKDTDDDFEGLKSIISISSEGLFPKKDDVNTEREILNVHRPKEAVMESVLKGVIIKKHRVRKYNNLDIKEDGASSQTCGILKNDRHTLSETKISDKDDNTRNPKKKVRNNVKAMDNEDVI